MRTGRIAVTVLGVSMVAILGWLGVDITRVYIWWLTGIYLAEPDIADITRVDDPVRLAERHIAASRYRVICVSHGWECHVLGIGTVNYERCYSYAMNSGMLGYQFGDLYTDDGDPHERKRSRHVEFASRYNLTIAGALDKLGKRGCPPGEDWDALVESVGSAVRQLDIVPGSPHVDATATSSHYFRFITDYPGYVNTAVRSAICYNAARHGVRHRVWVGVPPTDRFQCEAGKLVD